MSSDALTLYVRGIGLIGPGLNDWAGSRAALIDPTLWVSSPTLLTPPQLLPPAARRRAGAIVKLSLGVADQACAGSVIDPQTLATVFAASSGDPANCHALCEVLTTADRLVSPTRFTNSVHNAAAGYWHIATRSRAPSTSLCGFDASFGAGLLEAAAQSVSARRPVLLVACDVPYLEPLHGTRPLPDAFGMALLLDPIAPALPVPRLSLSLAGRGAVTHCDHAGFEALRTVIPAARSLPLMQALARSQSGEVVVEYLNALPLRLQIDGAEQA